jgi:MFS family permease
MAPFAGAIADRFDRRKVMIYSDTLAAMGTVILTAFLISGDLQLWHIYLSTSIGSIATAFQTPAYIAAIAQLVPKHHLGRANGIAQMAANTGAILSPMLGGVLVLAIGLSGVIVIDFLSFMFAIATLFFVRFPNTMFRQQEETFKQQILGGWRYIRLRPSLVAMIVFFAIYNLLASSFNVLMPPMVLALGDEVQLGTTMGGFSVGILIGAFIMVVTGGTRKRALGMLGAAGLAGLALAVTALVPRVGFITGGVFTVGIFAALLDSHWQVLIQTKIPFRLQGRVIATSQMMINLMIPVGFVLAGILSDNIFNDLLATEGAWANSVGQIIGTGPSRGMAFVLLLSGVCLSVWGLVGYLYPPLRDIETRLPDAVSSSFSYANLDEFQADLDGSLVSGD